MVGVVMVAGVVAQAVAWWFVAARRGSVWTVVMPVLVAMAVAAMLVEPPTAATEVHAAVAAVAGIVSGAALYTATFAFSRIVDGWAGFRRQSRAMYERRIPLSIASAVALSALVAAPAEELFWRGFFQREVADALDGATVLAAFVTTGVFVAANLASANVAIVLGAIVGGAAWSALAAWSGGVVAPLLCHAVWTALMLAFPVVREPADVAA